MQALALTPPPSVPAAKPGEYLSFRLGADEYAIGIRQVQEIRSYEAPVGVPNAPAALRGMLDLRGVITPIVDLRVAFNQEAPCTPQTGVIVLTVHDRAIGIVVDAVCDVLQLEAAHILPAPRLGGAGFDTHFVIGIGTVQQRMLILMDLPRLLDNPAMGLAL